MIRAFVGSTPFHKDVQPLLEAEDLDRGVVRVFSCMNIISVTPNASKSAEYANGLKTVLGGGVLMAIGALIQSQRTTSDDWSLYSHPRAK